MDKRKTIKIIFFLLLFVAAIVFISRACLDQVPEFAVKNPEKIKQIILKSDRGIVKLEKTGDIWMLNGTEEARMEAIKAILKTLSNIEIKSPLEQNSFNEIVSEEEIEVVEVNISGSILPLKKYFVYKVSANPYGNIMIEGGKNNPFIMHLPGYGGDISVFYNTQINYWKPHIIFQYSINDIFSIELENVNEPQNSFRISRNDSGGFILENLNGKEVLENVDSERITRYLSYFRRIRFEKYLNPDVEIDRDSITKAPVIYTLTLRDVNDDEKVICIFPVYLDEESKEMDSNVAYASISWENELILVKYFALDPILKNLDYFTR